MANGVYFKFTNNSKAPTKRGYTVLLRIKKNTIKKVRQIKVVVPDNDWDEKRGWIKRKAEESGRYNDVVKRFRAIEEKYPIVRMKVGDGTMTFDSAFNYLLNEVESNSLLEFAKGFKPDMTTKKQSTINKHISNISAVESNMSKLGYKQFEKLDFTHLIDQNTVEKIAFITHNEMGIVTNTISSYLKSLDWCSIKQKDFPRRNSFGQSGFVPTEKPSTKTKSIKKNPLLLGLNNVNTLHQLEAYLFWLYSFCLMGLDGTDICNISEDKVIEDTDGVFDYLPELDNPKKKRFSHKVHVGLSRGKSEVDFIIQVNLFPTLLIRDWLHYVVKLAHPNDTYEGKDRLRIFNFQTRKANGQEDTNGLLRWVEKRKSYSQEMRDRFDTTTQDTRKTITKTADKLGITRDKINVLLNHQIQSTLKYYLQFNQVERDIYQIHILQDFGINHIVRNSLEIFRDKIQNVDNRMMPFIPKDLFLSEWVIQNRKVGIDVRTEGLETDVLTHFSIQDELLYQTLMAEVKEGVIVPVDGVNVQKELLPSEYPERLNNLIKKRKTFVPEPDIKQDLNDKIKFI